jgi:hypothetical protein
MTPEYEQGMRGTLLGAQFLQALTLEKVRVFYGLESAHNALRGEAR